MHCTVPAQGKTNFLVPPPPALLGTSSVFLYIHPFHCFSFERRLPHKFPGTTPFQSLAPAKGFLSYLVTYLAALFWLSIEQCCPSSMPLPSYPLLDFFYRARSTTRMPWPRHLSSPVPRLFVLLVFLPVVFYYLLYQSSFCFPICFYHIIIKKKVYHASPLAQALLLSSLLVRPRTLRTSSPGASPFHSRGPLTSHLAACTAVPGPVQGLY